MTTPSIRLLADDAPTTGDPKVDLFTTSLALQIFVRPLNIIRIVRGWLIAASGEPGTKVKDAMPVPAFTYLLQQLIEGTTKCNLTYISRLPFHDVVDDRPPFTLHFFGITPRAVNLALTRDAIGRTESFAPIQWLLLELMGCPEAFLIKRPDPIDTRTMTLKEFIGNDRLRYYFEPTVFVLVACWLWVRELTRRPAFATDGPLTTAILLEIGRALSDWIDRDPLYLLLAQHFTNEAAMPAVLLSFLEQEARARLDQHSRVMEQYRTHFIRDNHV
jgi:hypothetical protein